MKTYFPQTLLLLISSLLLSTSNAFALPARATVWGFAGSDILARADVMAGLFSNCDHILWSDVQGKYGEEGAWMGSLGAGYRHVYDNARLLGLYAFMDYNVSSNGNSFWVASPGIESLGCIWDVRLNGYFPIGNHSKKAGTVTGDTLGFSQSVFFTGHQQFDRLFSLVDKVGNGVDGEIGRTFTNLHYTRAYIGGYYFDFHDHHDRSINSLSSVQGISGRLEFPVRPNVVLQAIDTYDNFAHNTLLVGLQISFGGCNHATFPIDIRDRILDPVSRNLGAQSTGNGIPIVQTHQDLGENILVRDHIYFFTAEDGTPFKIRAGTENGTFENPLAGTSFVQTTIDAIHGFDPDGANFYFTPGTYQFNPIDPNARISLHTDQSMWGRTADYSLPAQGDERAFFIGGIDLGVNFPAGNNRLDSIQVFDEVISSDPNADVNIITLEIANTSNVVLFNDNFSAIAIRIGNVSNIHVNAAAGIHANDSQVIIKDSTITAEVEVSGNNGGLNFAVGIGGNAEGTMNADFINNDFTIINSIIAASATTRGNNTIETYAAGIGGNSGFGESANLENNLFTIKNSHISGTAVVEGDNTLANFSTGIGGNNNNANSEFLNNTFILLNNNIEAVSIVGGNNRQGGSNYAAGIGGNSIFDPPGSADFINNDFTISKCNISGSAEIGSNNSASNNNPMTNFATGIGGNANTLVASGHASARFVGNNFHLENCNVNATATIRGNNIGFVGTSNNLATNFATGIGGNDAIPTDISTGSFFIDNIFTINGTSITANALVVGNNENIASINRARGVNVDGGGNTVGIDQSFVNVLAQILGVNNGINLAEGLLATGVDDVINISNSTINVLAPGGTATCTVGNVNLMNTTCN